MMTDPVISDAIKLRDALHECAKEFRVYRDVRSNVSGKTLAEYDARICQAAARMLEKLGTEVTRLRETIGCFHYGRANEKDLTNVWRSWNAPHPGDVEMPDIRKINL